MITTRMLTICSEVFLLLVLDQQEAIEIVVNGVNTLF